MTITASPDPESSNRILVNLGILGKFLVEVIRDSAGNRYLHVLTSAGHSVDDTTRAKVFETLLLKDHPKFQ